jgi:hypothetical protein
VGVGQKSRQRQQDHDGADKGGEIRVDALQPEFGEYRRQRREYCRSQRPIYPCLLHVLLLCLLKAAILPQSAPAACLSVAQSRFQAA